MNLGGSSSEEDNAEIMDIVTKQSVLTNKALNVKALYAGTNMINGQLRTGRPLPGNMSQTQPMALPPAAIQSKMRSIGSKFAGKQVPKGKVVARQEDRNRTSMAAGGKPVPAQGSIAIAKANKLKNIQALRRVQQPQGQSSGGMMDQKSKNKKIQIMDKKVRDRLRKGYQSNVKGGSKGNSGKGGASKGKNAKNVQIDDDDSMGEEDDIDYEIFIPSGPVNKKAPN